MSLDVAAVEPTYDFQGARFDLTAPVDRAVVRFILSQALFGEATGVYCGLSLHSARSLEAARFYVRQARQELSHLELFARIFRLLDMTPEGPHWTIRWLSTHNHHYPLKVWMEHAIGEGLVLDVFREVLLQTLPADDDVGRQIERMLRVICAEEIEHVQWGEAEVRRLLAERPSLRWPYWGLLELQLWIAPIAARAAARRAPTHPVLAHLEPLTAHVVARARTQALDLGVEIGDNPSLARRGFAVAWGLALLFRSRFSRGRPVLTDTYLAELGFPT